MSDLSPDGLKKSRENLPPEEGGIGVVIQQGGDVGVQGSVSKTIGKGWSVSAVGTWMKDAGWGAAAWLGWKGERK